MFTKSGMCELPIYMVLNFVSQARLEETAKIQVRNRRLNLDPRNYIFDFTSRTGVFVAVGR